MKILLTNDDGFESEGLCTLASVLRGAGHIVYIVAPHENNSAVSRKITMERTMRLRSFGEGEYSLEGTPVDCVLVALHFLGFKPDLVVSGINNGVNLGSDVAYSGTVAGAMEGAQNGIPAIALSLYARSAFPKEKNSALFRFAAETFLAYLTEWYALAHSLKGVLNVNFPDMLSPRGFCFCAASKTEYQSEYVKSEDGVRILPAMPKKTTSGDSYELRNGSVTLTPLLLDVTDYASLATWRTK